jgi:FkbM family methyltransferase
MKHKLRPLIEGIFRRLPVARAAYAERDALRERVLLSQERDVARFLKRADVATRNRLFDAFREVSLSDFLYVELDGLRFLVNANDQGISRSIFISGGSDFDKFDAAARILARHTGDRGIDLVVDVGANIGSICIPAVARGLAQRAVAIEPQPINCRLLRANVAVNGLDDRIEIFERAAASSDALPLTLELSEDNWGDHRISLTRTPGRYGEASRAHIEVKSIALDSLAAIDATTRFLLWMDIQGYEGHALQGAKRLLAGAPPLVLEFWPYGMLRADSFAALRQSVAHYKGFYDLQRPANSLRPVGELKDLFDEIGRDGRSTDILVI